MIVDQARAQALAPALYVPFPIGRTSGRPGAPAVPIAMKFGPFVVQGLTAYVALRRLKDAHRLEGDGCFALENASLTQNFTIHLQVDGAAWLPGFEAYSLVVRRCNHPEHLCWNRSWIRAAMLRGAVE